MTWKEFRDSVEAQLKEKGYTNATLSYIDIDWGEPRVIFVDEGDKNELPTINIT